MTGQRQVNRALGAAELKAGEQEIMVVCAGNNKKNLKRNFEILEREIGFKAAKDVQASIRKSVKRNRAFIMEFYGVGGRELLALSGTENPLGNAVLEKCAMLALE